MPTAIFNCKKCKIGKRIDYPRRASNGYRSYFYRVNENNRQMYPGDDAMCQCGRTMAWNYLDAILRPEVRCDARCTGARGHKCDCSCSGRNHGAGWTIGPFRAEAA